MCSNQEDEPICSDPQPSLKSHPQKCMKCDKEAVTIARTKDPFCSNCFCTYFVQRFRTTLGKSRLLKPGEKILLAFSGGASSRVLLQLIEYSISEQASKRLRINPSVLFVDEGAVLNQSKEERCRSIIDTLSIAEEGKFQSFFIPLEQAFSPITEVYSLCSPSSVQERLNDNVLSILCQYEGSPLTQLSTIFENFKSLTAKENFLTTLRQRLLIEVAQRNDFTKVFTGDSATRVSIRLLSNIAQGRGSTIPLDMGLLDDRNKDALLIRPLREFPNQEIKAYVSIKNLKVVNTMPTLQDVKESIEGTAETFINGLQENFPSTVNTIFRTGEKLSVQTGEDFCDLCKAPLLQLPDESVFEHLPHSDKKLCYGCKLTVRDMVGAVDYLPFSGDQASNH